MIDWFSATVVAGYRAKIVKDQWHLNPLLATRHKQCVALRRAERLWCPLSSPDLRNSECVVQWYYFYGYLLLLLVHLHSAQSLLLEVRFKSDCIGFLCKRATPRSVCKSICIQVQSLFSFTPAPNQFNVLYLSQMNQTHAH